MLFILYSYITTTIHVVCMLCACYMHVVHHVYNYCMFCLLQPCMLCACYMHDVRHVYNYCMLHLLQPCMLCACYMHDVRHVYNYCMLLFCIVYCILFISHNIMVCLSLYAAIGDQLNAQFNLKVSV